MLENEWSIFLLNCENINYISAFFKYILNLLFIETNNFCRKRTDELITTLDKKQEAHREVLEKLQMSFQQAQKNVKA